MKPVKSLVSQHHKNQRSLTLDISRELPPRQHYSNPKPRPLHPKAASLTATHKYHASLTTKLHPSKNFLKLKTDPSTITALPLQINKFSLGDLKNDSLSKIISKRKDSFHKSKEPVPRNKDSCAGLKERKQKQRLSIEIYNKISPQGRSMIHSTKAINRRRSTLISKIKTQASEDMGLHSNSNPQASKDLLRKFGNRLQEREVEELLQTETVYYMQKRQGRQMMGEENGGYDDRKGFYLCEPGDHICYRFEVISRLGKGSFGEVFKAFDHKKKEAIALKIIRNRKTPNSQALIQYGILRTLVSCDSASQNIVRVFEAFRFRNHFCMTFELLSVNLYDLLKSHNFTPFSSELVRRLAIQVLSTLIYLRRRNIIHCDLKPENILLKQADKSGIKIIDFGSSCYSDEKMYSYIQSRYYRAPEVILGSEYSFHIDMWSFACVIAEMKLTYPLFGGEDEGEQVGLISEVIGLPDTRYYLKTERGALYFDKGPLKDRENEVITPGARPLRDLFPDTDFVDFLSQILVWEPTKRMSPIQALRHQWILKGIPEGIRSQHLQYLNEQQCILNGSREKRQSSTLSQQILNRK